MSGRKGYGAAADWQAMQNGCHDAYTRIVSGFFKPMFAYGIRLYPDDDHVKDCIQNIFQEIWYKRKRLSVPVSTKAYLFSSLRYLLLREIANRSRTESLTEEHFFDAEISIESKMIADQEVACMKERIANVLNSMPARQREILYLRFYENLNHQRISEVMGIGPQVVYNLMHKSLIRFRKEWAAVVLLLPLLNLHFSTPARVSGGGYCFLEKKPFYPG